MRHRITTSLSTLALMIGVLAVSAGAGTAGATTTGVVPRDDAGIHVVSTEVLSDRLLDSTLTTPAVNRPVGVRVLLPSGYDPTGSTRYPVLYLLHGGFGSYVDWTQAGGVTDITAGLPVIVVMPDGGKGGWYSNWSNFGFGGAPAWETFHIDQLIPWVDANFRTVASRAGRAIAGLSMGGFGAMSYAARHPGLFAAVASFSGAVDIQNPAVAALIQVSPVIDGGLPGSIYGIGPFDQPGLIAHNPAAMASNLRGMRVALYTGNGQNGPLDGGGPTIIPDVQETVVHANNVVMNDRLNAAGVEHTFVDYGNGTHSFGYWTRDLAWEMPHLMDTFAHPTPAGNAVRNGGFEGSGMDGWQCAGRCGVDHGLGLAHSRSGNGWARNAIGWNDVHTTVPVAANARYRLTGWIRTSSNNRNGYFGIRSTSGSVLGEARFARFGSYTRVTVDVATGTNTDVVVYGGAWSNLGDTWIQLDDVSLTPL